jgi:2-keto-4-pentenoate hydratase
VKPDMSSIDQICEALASARSSGTKLAWQSLPQLSSNDEGRAAQHRLLDFTGGTIAGWKAAVLGSGEVLGAPIYESDVAATGARIPAPRQGGFEVEIAFRLAADLPAGAEPYTRESVIGAVDQVLIGIERLDSRLQDFTKVPMPIYLADNLGTAGYVLGAAVPFRGSIALAELRCVAEVGGRVVHDAVGGHHRKDPLDPLVRLANAGVPGGLRAGQFVTTGSLTPLLEVGAGHRLTARIEDIGEVTIEVA